MKLKTFIVSFILVGLTVQSRSLETSQNQLRCGGAINPPWDTATVLSYKENEPVLSNERCVWSFRTQNANIYKINVTHLGERPSDDHRVVLSCFDVRNAGAAHLVLQSVDSFEYWCNLLVVTFQTGEAANSTGFSLTVTPAAVDWLPRASNRSLDYVETSEVHYIKHPTSEFEHYDNLELSSFIFVPNNNTYNPGLKMEVEYTKLGLNFGCEDYLQVFMYNVSSEHIYKWDYQTEYCGTSMKDTITSRDIVMVVFHSDDDFDGRGFEFRTAP